MQSLDAALAFAITMLVLSMVVTTLVETLHRIFAIRERGLELLLGSIYDRLIAARGAGPADAGSRLAFVQMMTANRAPAGCVMGWLWRGRRLDRLGVVPFMERLGGTRFGAGIINDAAAAGDEAVSAVLKDISQKFEAFGREASVYFEARARLVSIGVGFALAILINVNAFTLFDTFMRNPEVTRAVIEKGGEAQKAYEKLAESVTKLDAAAKSVEKGAAAPAKPAGKAQPPAKPGADPVDEALKEIQEARKRADEAASMLKGIGVPIGWDERSAAPFVSLYRNGEMLGTAALAALGLALGGLLIGLGAPFWYDAVKGLTNIRSLFRGPSSSGAAAQGASPRAALVAQPETPIEAFIAARQAADVARPPRPPEEPVG